MDPNERQKRLKEYLEKISPGIYDTRTGGLESTDLVDPEMTGLEGGLKKLASNETLSNSESMGLEAIVHKKHRPAVFVINNTFSEPPNPWTHLGEGTFRSNLESVMPSIGRIELPADSGIPFGGTGFIVGPSLIMTNRHVAEIFAHGIGTKNLRFKTGMSAGINLRKEVVPTPDIKDLTVTKIEMIHPFWDMALLRVEGLLGNQWLSLSTQHPEDMIGNDIAVIGYPAQDPRNDIDLQNEIFGGVYNVKRMQPGKLDSRRQITSFGNDVNAITHDASTLGGNSGSAVVDVQSGQILALHFAGLYLDANFAVPTMELARDPRVVDSGVNFTGRTETGAPWLQRWETADRLGESNVFPTTSNNVAQTPADDTSQHSSNHVANANNQVSITIPLTITISVGEPGTSHQVTVEPVSLLAQAAELEGSSAGSDEILNAAYLRASSKLLRQNSFSTTAALTTAAASALVYSNNQSNMEQTCRSDFEFNTCKFLRNNNTECFVATSNDTALISFRGTQGIADWVANMNIAEQATEFGMVHAGFLRGFQDIKAILEEEIDAAISNNMKLVLTGHSLGGALATIARSEWRNRYPIRSVYTFGQPAVGDRKFRDSMNAFKDDFFRVVNDDDIVTRIPPPYKHVGTKFKLPPTHQLETPNIESPPKLETVTDDQMLSELAFLELQTKTDPALESAGLEGILPSFKDHKISNYLTKLMRLTSPS